MTLVELKQCLANFSSHHSVNTTNSSWSGQMRSYISSPIKYCIFLHCHVEEALLKQWPLSCQMGTHQLSQKTRPPYSNNSLLRKVTTPEYKVIFSYVT